MKNLREVWRSQVVNVFVCIKEDLVLYSVFDW